MLSPESKNVRKISMNFPEELFDRLEAVAAESIHDINGVITDSLKFRRRLLRELELYPYVMIGDVKIDADLSLTDYKSTKQRRKHYIVIDDSEFQYVEANSSRLKQKKDQYIRGSVAIWVKVWEEISKQTPVQTFSGIEGEINGKPVLIFNI